MLKIKVGKRKVTQATNFLILMKKLENVLKSVVQGQNFVNAYQALRQNKGVPGVDGLFVRD